MKTLATIAVGLALGCFCSDSFAQCSASRGGGQGFASSARGGGQGGRQPQLLTGQGSFFHDQMVQNFQRQQMQRYQQAVMVARQAKRNERRGQQLNTRRTQRELELARREAKKRAASLRQNFDDSNQVRLASYTR